MKRRSVVPILMAGVLLAVVAGPVSADARRMISSEVDMTLLAQPCPDGRFLTWAGTTTIDGEVYGWADFPTADPVTRGPFMYFQEYWTIFTLAEEEVVSSDLACDPGRVVMDGENKGVGMPAAFVAFAWGKVASTADGGPFEDVPVGSRMFWFGHLPERRDPIPGDHFIAKLRIVARR